MNNYIERLLYIALVMIFIGVGIAFYVVMQLSNNQANQIKKLQELNHSQQQTINQIKSGVADLKNSNNQQTEYLQCLLAAQNLGDFPGICQAPTGTFIPTPVTSTTSSQPTPTTQTQPTPPPTPSPPPTVGQRIQKVIRDTLKVLGL